MIQVERERRVNQGTFDGCPVAQQKLLPRRFMSRPRPIELRYVHALPRVVQTRHQSSKTLRTRPSPRGRRSTAASGLDEVHARAHFALKCSRSAVLPSTNAANAVRTADETALLASGVAMRPFVGSP